MGDYVHALDKVFAYYEAILPLQPTFVLEQRHVQTVGHNVHDLDDVVAHFQRHLLDQQLYHARDFRFRSDAK